MDQRGDPIIDVKELRKVYSGRWPSFWRALTSRPDGTHPRDIVALDSISFSVKRGEVVGIIGHNGAGKSTLLRLIAGIATPTGGRVFAHGQIGMLMDLSAGLIPTQSGLWNIRHRLTLTGVPVREQVSLLDEIVEFAELEDVIAQPLMTYSTGMRMRLAFAISTAVRPDVILIDEVLAVGDEFFSAKSFRRIEDMMQEGTTSIVVSHDWTKIFRLCTRIIWIDNGKIRADDKPSALLYPYLNAMNAYRISGAVRVISMTFRDRNGVPVNSLAPNDPLTIEVEYEKDADVPPFAVIPGCTHVMTGESILSAWSPDYKVLVGQKGATRGRFSIQYSALPIPPGDYDFSVLLADIAQGAFPLEYLGIYGPMQTAKVRITIPGTPEPRNPPLLELPARWLINAAPSIGT